MKNIHLLPTDKPSRLFLKENTLLLNNQYTLQEVFPKGKCQNIYITNDEEIKVGDYFIESLGLPDSYLVHKLSKEWKDKESFYRRCTKVILTTDTDLIEDRVESIDDDFLEWFVKNLSCEEVGIHELRFFNPNTNESGHCKWELIIPTEEPKQETIEEAAANLADPSLCKTDNWIAGAKWQAERMYSEEDMIHFNEWVTIMYPNQRKLLTTSDKRGFYTTKELLIKWFEQFKKK